MRFIPANALKCEWPGGRCAIMMSYLFSGVPETSIQSLINNAFVRLRPGGTLMVHDFMIDEENTQPQLAALWHMQHMAFTPEAASISSARIIKAMETVGFEAPTDAEVIANMTRIVCARKPS